MRWIYYSFRKGFLYVCKSLLGSSFSYSFRYLCWILWKMFLIEGVVSTSSLYQLILLKDVRTGAELFPGNSLVLLGLNLDFVLSHRLPICQRRSRQHVQFAGQSITSRPTHLQYMHDAFVSRLALTSWSTCISASSVVGARGLQ